MPEGAPPRIEQLMNSDDVSPALSRIGRSSPVVDVLDQLMAPDQDLLLLHSKTLMRAGDARSKFPWHQDFGYWHYTHQRPLQLNCSVAIEPQSVAAGCLRFVEGSQQRGMVEHTRFERLVDSSFSIGLAGDQDAYPAVAVEYEPGDALFFGPLVIHGSDRNHTGSDARFNTFAYDLRDNRKEPGQDPLVRHLAQRLHVH